MLYFFQNKDTDVFAFSTDRTGGNIPLLDLSSSWFLRDEVTSLRFFDGWCPGDFQYVLDDLDARGFHILRGQYIPFATAPHRAEPLEREQTSLSQTCASDGTLTLRDGKQNLEVSSPEAIL